MKLKIFTKTRFLATVCCLITIALTNSAFANGKPHHKHHKRIYGLTTISSNYSAAETLERLQSAILDRGLAVIAVIDHAANAANVGLELRPTTLILWGSATIGTQIMQSEQTVGIDVPLKFLVWENKKGDVHISYNTADFIQHRHRVRDNDDVFDTISGALESISTGAAGLDE